MNLNHSVMKKLFFIIGFIIYSFVAYSQPNKFLEKEIKETDIIYNKPKGFIEVYPDTSYFPMYYFAPLLPSGVLLYEIKSIKYGTSVSVGIINLRRIKEFYKNAQTKHHFSSSVIPDYNTDYLRHPHPMVDSINTKVYYFSDSYSLKKWNAQKAIQYKIDLLKSNKRLMYRNKYDSCNIIVIHKDDCADIVLYYWFNKKAASVLKLVIEQTIGMFQFKN